MVHKVTESDQLGLDYLKLFAETRLQKCTLTLVRKKDSSSENMNLRKYRGSKIFEVAVPRVKGEVLVASVVEISN